MLAPKGGKGELKPVEGGGGGQMTVSRVGIFLELDWKSVEKIGGSGCERD